MGFLSILLSSYCSSRPIKNNTSIMIGSAVTGALSMLFKVTLAVPHGGIFVLPIPNAVGGLGLYALAIIIGTVVTGVLVATLKQKRA